MGNSKVSDSSSGSASLTRIEKFDPSKTYFGNYPLNGPSLVTNNSSYAPEDMVFNDLLEENSAKEEIIPVSVNDLFYDILSSNIATNMYDAESGKFIAKERLNEKLWLDKELIFEERSNGTYLISIVDDVGNKVAMGFTDTDTYNKYMDALKGGVSYKVEDDEPIVVEGEVVLAYDNSSTVNANSTIVKEENVASNSSSNNVVNENGNTSTSSSVDYAERYVISCSYSGTGEFKLTTDNKTYTDMSLEDMLEVAAVVYAEAAPGIKPDDALAVASVIANREDSVRADTGAAWGGYQKGLKEVVAAPGQFSTYGGSAYNEFLSNYKNGIITERMQMCLDVVEDVKNGVRNNDYQAFRSAGTVSYSNNCIVDGGNRYAIVAQV